MKELTREQMEENKLIAEFMGLPKVPCNIGTEDGYFTEGYKHPNVAAPTIPSGMQYKYSWNWLMDVVEKIECTTIDNDDNSDTFFNVMIEVFECNINGGYIRICESGNNKREATYNAVLEFIKQYNN